MPPGKVNDPQDEDQNVGIGYIERGDICVKKEGKNSPVMIPYSTTQCPGLNIGEEVQFDIIKARLIFNERLFPVNFAYISAHGPEKAVGYKDLDIRDVKNGD